MSTKVTSSRPWSLRASSTVSVSTSRSASSSIARKPFVIVCGIGRSPVWRLYGVVRSRLTRQLEQCRSEPEGGERPHGDGVRLPVVQQPHADEVRHRQAHDCGCQRLGIPIRLCGPRELDDQPLQFSQVSAQPRRGPAPARRRIRWPRRGSGSPPDRPELIEPGNPALEEHAQARACGPRWRAAAR